MGYGGGDGYLPGMQRTDHVCPALVCLVINQPSLAASTVVLHVSKARNSRKLCDAKNNSIQKYHQLYRSTSEG